VYEEALAYEFDLRKIQYERQRSIDLKYKGKDVGHHRLDFLVEGKVVLEVKTAENLLPMMEAQLLTYLNAAGQRVGLLVNFNVPVLKQGIKRMILQRSGMQLMLWFITTLCTL